MKTILPKSLLNKVADFQSTTVLKLKEKSGSVVFLRILRNFVEHLFNRTLSNDCFEDEQRCS